MPQSKTTQRRTWTDADKEALVRKVAAYPGKIQDALKKEGIDSAQFYRLRTSFLKAHPEIDLVKKLVPAVKMLPSGWPVDPEERKKEMRRRMTLRQPSQKQKPLPGQHKFVPGSFAALPDAEKTTLIKEYYALPFEAKLPWREKYNMTGAMAVYWHKRLVKNKARATREAVVDPAVASALAEYRDLPNVEKAPWRKAHHLNSAQLYQISRGIATSGVTARILSSNGNQQLTIRDQRLARIPDPISMIPNSAPPLTSVPVTVDDAILAFEVKRDHMNEFIDELKRLQRGGR